MFEQWHSLYASFWNFRRHLAIYTNENESRNDDEGRVRPDQTKRKKEGRKKRMSLCRGGIIAAIMSDNNDTVVAVA